MFEKHFETQTEENERRKNLEGQFKNRENLQFGEEEIKVVDIATENLKTDTPLVLAPGWAASPEVFKDNILRLAESGRRILAVDEYHGISTEKTEDYSQAQRRKAEAILEMIRQKGIEKVDVVAHSEGAIYITMAAIEQPEKFRNLILVNPGGMIGKDTRMRLIMGVIEDILKQDKNRYTNRLAIDIGKGIIDNPKASVKEVFGIVQAQIEELLKILKEKGIGISIIHSVNDKFFPMEQIQNITKTDMVDGFYSVKGNHNQIVSQPKEYTDLVDHALDALEKKQSKN